MIQIKRLCPICERFIKFYVETEKAVEGKMKEHQKHLCNTCKKDFIHCNGEPIFGNCKGNDNVIECKQYVKKEG